MGGGGYVMNLPAHDILHTPSFIVLHPICQTSPVKSIQKVHFSYAPFLVYCSCLILLFTDCYLLRSICINPSSCTTTSLIVCWMLGSSTSISYFSVEIPEITPIHASNIQMPLNALISTGTSNQYKKCQKLTRCQDCVVCVRIWHFQRPYAHGSNSML